MERKQMKSNVCSLNRGSGRLEAILNVTGSCAEYLELDKKQTLQLRLLAEEIVGMLPELLELCEGEFWIENENEIVELHVTASVTGLDDMAKEKLLSISSSGKNVAVSGVMGKIRGAAQFLLSHLVAPGSVSSLPLSGADMLYAETTVNNYIWSLSDYKSDHAQNKAGSEWDELERSIVANIADDVTVGIVGSKVEIIVKKAF